MSLSDTVALILAIQVECRSIGYRQMAALPANSGWFVGTAWRASAEATCDI